MRPVFPPIGREWFSSLTGLTAGRFIVPPFPHARRLSVKFYSVRGFFLKTIKEESPP